MTTVIPLAVSGDKALANVLALGGWFKNTACAVHGGEAHISPLIGDLDQADACLALEAAVEQLCAGFEPELIVHDLHPDFYSTRLALEIAERMSIPAIGVQHHHAHVASVCAEHHVTGAVIGLGLDGVGLGSDGKAWGGELLKVDGGRFERLDHLYELRLPGGDKAAREPWRMAASALDVLGRGHEIATRFSGQAGAVTVATMLQRKLNCPPTSSMGRLFDAAAGLLGICPVQSFEGEAAVLLQTLAERHGDVEAMPEGYRLGDSLDFRRLLETLANGNDGGDIGYLAALFHATLAAGLAAWVKDATERCGIDTLVCGGGCFLNRLLLRHLTRLMGESGISVLSPRRLSPGDSGLSLGQAWVGMFHLQGID
jgi:hydrogenase maturation protein HypF